MRYVEQGSEGVAQDCLEDNTHVQQQHGEYNDEVIARREAVLQLHVLVKPGAAHESSMSNLIQARLREAYSFKR